MSFRYSSFAEQEFLLLVLSNGIEVWGRKRVVSARRGVVRTRVSERIHQIFERLIYFDMNIEEEKTTGALEEEKLILIQNRRNSCSEYIPREPDPTLDLSSFVCSSRYSAFVPFHKEIESLQFLGY